LKNLILVHVRYGHSFLKVIVKLKVLTWDFVQNLTLTVVHAPHDPGKEET